MYQIALLAAMLLLSIAPASAERIKRPPPDEADLARRASDEAMNDDLRRGDIVSTDHGFLQLRGVKQDGSYDFAPVANPLISNPTNPRAKR
jgi:hypothetical protein